MWGFPSGGNSKETACWCSRCKRCEFNPWVEKVPWRGKWHSTPVVLPAIFQKQRILANYNPMEWGCKESDTTELLSMSCRSKFSAPMITRLRALPVSLQQNYLEPGGSSRIFPAITAAHNISFSSVWSIFLFSHKPPKESEHTTFLLTILLSPHCLQKNAKVLPSLQWTPPQSHFHWPQ